MSDFSQWLEGAPLVPATEEITFGTWLDGAPVASGVETPVEPPTPVAARRRVWMAHFESRIFVTTPIIARFTFETDGLDGWIQGPSTEMIVTTDFEADSFEEWVTGEVAQPFTSETHDFEDESLALWTTG